MTKRVHDADLCDRIKALEDRVRELEARPAHHCTGHYWYYPYNAYPWTYTVTSGTTSSNVYYGNTLSVSNDNATDTPRES